jgi:hypothetical protein
MTKDINKIILDNETRRAKMNAPYNPGTGEGSHLERIKVDFFHAKVHYVIYFPNQMFKEMPGLRKLKFEGSVEKAVKSEDILITQAFINDLNRERFKYDFEFWAYICAKIQDKESKKEIPFVLNRAQRRLLYHLEQMRLAKRPIRVILLKARQWGGSTLTQVYMAWMQLIVKTNWHSAIIADVDDQSRNIRGMYKRLGRLYPKQFGSITFIPYEGSSKTKVIRERNCIVGVGSAQEPDSLRSYDFSMLHLSEVGIWKSTPQRSAEDLVQSIRSTVPTIPDSLIVMESTAKGVGNFFHREWQAAKKGTSSYDPVFVPWFEIERYQNPITDYDEFIAWMNAEISGYAKFLWSIGATLEGIKWYFDTKNGENYDDWRMKSEYPSNDTEAFQSTGRTVFRPEYIANLRKTCRKPEFIGELVGDAQTGPDSLKNIEFKDNPKGNLWIWSMPDTKEQIAYRYALFGDIGGRTAGADYSVLRVIDRYWMMTGGKPETVATWWGHLDQDIFAWVAAQLGMFYGCGLLAIETNSLRTRKATEGDHFITILDEIAPHYSNLFARTDPEKIKMKVPIKWGFHTNSGTKSLIINTLNAAARDSTYVETDERACDEMETLEYKVDGSIGAVDGSNDDLAITTAGDVWLALKYMSLPVIIKPYITDRDMTVQSEASFN